MINGSNTSVAEPDAEITKVLREVTSESQDLMAGLFICSASLFGLLGYIPVIYVMLKSPSLKHPVYTLMASLGVTDSASLVIWFISGMFTLSHGTLIPQALMDWLMVIIEYGWYSLVCHVAAISFNRYMAVCRPNTHRSWFDGRLKGKHWMIMTCTLTFFINFPTYVPPGPGFFIDGWYFNWKDAGVIEFYWYFDQGLCSLVFFIMIIEYTLIIK
ncbi:MAG: G-protein coupled receptor [Gammaproteobacteria bacterium]|nr:G-protein coupled receptor [Gammaproteobacteria bacterium]